VTLASKRRILKQALEGDWLLVFEHDAALAWSRIAHDGKTYCLPP
jgi:hypothetical protein